MRQQSGFGVMLVLVIMVLAGTYVFVDRLSAAATTTAARRDHNARVLNQAKQALIGYVAMKAGQTGEQDPGTLPCPEAPGNYANPALEGTAAGNCSVPAVGRLPWRTLGLDKLTDDSGEPLWYVVSPGWHKPSSTTFAVVNSNSIGQLSVDGVANNAVALVIAPGAPLLSNATGCAGVAQTRSTASANLVNYLDCDNATAADSSFTTGGPTGSFNDQVLRVTARDIIPAIEAAIAPRLEREIVPAMRGTYASSAWGSNVSAANPFYPYAAPFADPAQGASYKGNSSSCSADSCQGLLPVVYIGDPMSAGVCSTAVESACDPNFVRWTSGTIQVSEVTVDGVLYTIGTIVAGVLEWNAASNNTCTVATINAGTSREHTELRCNARVPGASGYASNDVRYRISANATNVGMAFRRFDTTGLTIQTPPTATVNSAGTATVTFEGRVDVPAGGGTLVGTLLGGLGLCGLNVTGILSGILSGVQCREFEIRVPVTFFGDAPVVDAKHPDVGWFARNEWYRVLYFAEAKDVTPANTKAPTCDKKGGTGKKCLALDAVEDKRALLFLAGRSLNGTIGHTRTLSDLLEHSENRNNDDKFVTQRIATTNNDRGIVVQVNP
jgi:hypothetical protein